MSRNAVTTVHRRFLESLGTVDGASSAHSAPDTIH